MKTEKGTKGKMEAVAILRKKAQELGRQPKKSDFSDIEVNMVKSCLGPWPRALEEAGLKEVSEGRRERLRNREEKHIRAKVRRRVAKTDKKAGPDRPAR